LVEPFDELSIEGKLMSMVAAASTVLQAIKSATAHGPRCLGNLGMAPRSGQLRHSYDADIVALAASPLDDVGVLARPDAITHVWKAGQLYKSPTMQHAFTEQERVVPWSNEPRQGFAV